jgi:hypothetical protein
MRNPTNRGGIRTYLLLIGLLAGAVTTTSLAIGTALLLASFGLQFWSKGCLHQNRQVARTGPYRFVRHPFYFANALLDSGIVIMSGFWPLMIVAPIWWLAVYIPVMRREEAHLTQLFGDEYTKYAGTVPRFIPWRKPLPRGASGFSWSSRNILETETSRALKYLAYPIMFYFSMRFVESGWALLSSPLETDILVLILICSLFAAAQFWRAHFLRCAQLLPRMMLRLPIRIALMVGIAVVGVARAFVDPIEQDWAHWMPGAMVLAGSLLIATLGRVRTFGPIAEGLFVAAFMILLELQLFAVLVIPLYLAIALDLRTMSESQVRVLAGARFAAVVVIGVGIAVAAEFL